MPLNGKPILQHVIEFYIDRRFQEFVLCAGFRADAIRQFVVERKFDADIEVSNAGEDASMLRRLYEVSRLMGERAMVTYGDTFVNIDPQQMLQEHLRRNVGVTITIADIRSPFGVVKVDAADRVCAFDEKPLLPYYIGHMVMERSVLDDVDQQLLDLPDGQGLVGLFQALIAKQQLSAYKHTGLRITFNTASEREQAEEAMMKFFTQREQ